MYIEEGGYRSSHLEVFCKQGVLKNFFKIHWKSPLTESLFNKVEDLKPAKGSDFVGPIFIVKLAIVDATGMLRCEELLTINATCHFILLKISEKERNQ